MNSFFPTQPHISRRSLGAVGLSVAASLGLPSAFAHADTADPTTTGESSRLVLPPEGGFRLDSAEFSRLYGPGVFTMSTLYNVPVGIEGGMDKIASLRFRAVVSGPLQKIRLYWPTGSGYSAGTGGRIRITVLPDDGSDKHLPVLSRIKDTVERLKANRRAAALADGALAEARKGATRSEDEVDQVTRRAAILRERLSSGTANPRDLTAIQGELDQLGRRRAVLEDAQLAAVEALESAQRKVRDLAAEESEIRSAGRELTAERDAAFARIDAEIDRLDRERAELAGTIDLALLDEYDAVRAATGGLGAVALHGRRLEGSPIQISPMEYSRIAAAPADEIIHAEENDVIIVRMDI